MAHPLSDKEMIHYLGNKVNIFTYTDIHKIDDVNKMLGRYGRCLILFLNKENYGHWTCLFLNKEKGQDTLHFFNSYGDLKKNNFDGYPDSFLKYINKTFRNKSAQDYPYLSDLLINSSYPLEYNPYQFQKLHKDVVTCGYWCLCRLMYSNLTDDEFKNFIDENCRYLRLSPDDLVVNIINI